MGDPNERTTLQLSYRTSVTGARRLAVGPSVAPRVRNKSLRDVHVLQVISDDLHSRPGGVGHWACIWSLRRTT